MDLSEKIIVITGANSGVGFAAAKSLAKRGATIVMVCRDYDKGMKAKAEIENAATWNPPLLYIADLSSQASIRCLADQLNEDLLCIDVLINNAGAIFQKRELNANGIEQTFATNHLGPFLLTNLLLDLVQAAPKGRILIVASESHNGSIDFDNLQGEKTYNFFSAYNHSKLCNILFANELARRLEGTNITVNSLSPGPTATTFGNHMTGIAGLFPRIMKNIPFLFSKPEKSVATYLYAATSPKLEGVSGKFFLKGREARTKAITHDAGAASRLWAISEQLTALQQHII